MIMPSSPDEIIDKYSGMISRGMAEEMARASAAAGAAAKKMRVEEILSADKLPQVIDIEDTVYRVFSKMLLQGGAGNYYRRIILGTEGRTISATLWRGHADLVDTLSIERGDFILAKSLAPRVWQGSTELTSTAATTFSRITPSSTGIVDYSKIAAGAKDVDVIGKVVDVGPLHSFTTLSGRASSVADCNITNGSRNIRIVLWDSASRYAEAIRPGDYIKVEFVNAKEANGAIELHAGNGSRILASQQLRSKLQNV